MSQWVVVVHSEGWENRGPSVIGPFENSDLAAEYGNSIRDHVESTYIATLNPIPPAYRKTEKVQNAS